MAISVVQSKAATGTSLTLTSATTSGNCLVVFVMDDTDGPLTAVTLGGSAGNFTQLLSDATTAFDPSVWAWADPNCAGGQTSVAITLTSNRDPVIFAYEVAGLASSSVLDVSSSGTNHSTANPYTSGTTATTSQAAEIWFGAMCKTSGTPTTPSSPWINTSQNGSGTFTYAAAGYQIVSSTGTFAYSATNSGSNPATAVALALKGAATASSSKGLLMASFC